ncbi:hypothetical protein [Teredinibacter purpureus]|uniref:hypothetical protein n=1 Tax=Teredinibacter purpureus TaxID=2731756 RepID=UPI0005F79566|nr:hypothetical protein [Teredinibacter purpureus]
MTPYVVDTTVMFKAGMETIDLIKSDLIRLRDSLKSKPEAELKVYEKEPLKKEYDVFGKKYPLVIYSEMDQDGTLNVIVEATKYHLFGSSTSYSEGFKIQGGTIIDLTEQELWEFD